MPLFKRAQSKREEPTTTTTNGTRKEPEDRMEPKARLVFHCQQAHGSPTGLISGFSNIKELYQKISECYDFPASEILFCTLNTHKVDMTKLLGGQIGLEDFIFAHRKGRPKEIEITKTEDSLGLTITDNGAGYSFIKRIKEGSIVDKIDYIQIGDHIEKIDDECLVGRRHFEVAKMLKEIPVGTVFTLRIIGPMKAGFANVDARSNYRSKNKIGYGSGKETLRFKANGQAQIVEEPNKEMQLGLESINRLLDNYIGINDNELATQIWETAEGKGNSMDFATAIDDSDLATFGFSDDMIIELWGAVTDARAGRTRQQPS